MSLKSLIVFIACAMVFVLPSAFAQKAFADPIDQEIEQLMSTLGSADVRGNLPVKLFTSSTLERVYENRGYSPVWSASAIDELFEELNEAVLQGFQPTDFHLTILYDLQEAAKSGNPTDVAVFDLVASDAALKLAHHMFFGKVDPTALDKDWNFSRPVINRDPADIFNSYMEGGGLSALIERLDVDTQQYELLVDGLARYRDIAKQGGWPLVPDTIVLKPGITDTAILLLRERLVREGVATEASRAGKIEPDADPLHYDDQLATAVRAFQARHGLEADGIVGPKTFSSLNRTVEDRVNQLRLSLERGRWLMRELKEKEEFVLVNIAAPRTYFFMTEGSVWSTRSITGSAYRKTPVFRDKIEYMEFNPTWTVPASIFRKDLLPHIRRDVGYLAHNNYRVVRTSDRRSVPASSVNWLSSNPGVTLVQQPGPNNALGLVKFMFPNKYAVYLHDTNDRSLFQRNERNLSSGCVRLEDAFEFASLLMEGDPDWSSQRMQAILDSKKTTRINLEKPMPVLLTYWTAWVENGTVHFREDPYSRDGPVLAALNK